MAKNFTKDLLARMIAAAVLELEQKPEELNRLDAATGDGDHGTSILKAMRAAAAAARAEGSLKDILHGIAWTIEDEACGSTSSLTGSLYEGMSEAVDSEELNVDEVIEMFVSGLACVERATKAKVGDKTIMDALIPAVDMMKSMRQSSVTLAELLTAAAESARFGADSTRDCLAKFGRAKNLGERVRGHLDPGACSAALILETFARVAKEA